MTEHWTDRAPSPAFETVIDATGPAGNVHAVLATALQMMEQLDIPKGDYPALYFWASGALSWLGQAGALLALICSVSVLMETRVFGANIERPFSRVKIVAMAEFGKPGLPESVSIFNSSPHIQPAILDTRMIAVRRKLALVERWPDTLFNYQPRSDDEGAIRRGHWSSELKIPVGRISSRESPINIGCRQIADIADSNITGNFWSARDESVGSERDYSEIGSLENTRILTLDAQSTDGNYEQEKCSDKQSKCGSGCYLLNSKTAPARPAVWILGFLIGIILFGSGMLVSYLVSR